MATASTLTAIRQRALRELGLGLVIPNGFVGAFAATTVTSTQYLQNTDIDTNHFRSRGTGIFRPGAASSADFWRMAGDLVPSTGVLSHTGLNYSDTTVGSEIVELWYHLKGGFRPDQEVLDALNRSMEFIFFDTCYEALSHIHHLDGAMLLATDTDWTDVGTPTTSAKATTARRTPFGLRSYQLVADAVNEGTQSATIPWDAEEDISAWTIASADAGTSSIQPYDVTASAAFGTAVTYSGEEPMFLKQDWVSVPTSSEEGAVQLLGTVNPSTVFFNGLWLYKRNQLRIELDAHVNDGFEVIDIYQAVVQNEVATNTYRAQGVKLKKVPKSEYDVLISSPGAVASAIQFRNNSWFDYPLLMQTRRPFSDATTFSAESDTTTAPLHLLIPRFKIEILDTCVDRASYPNWDYERVKAEREWRKALNARPISTISPPYWGGLVKV